MRRFALVQWKAGADKGKFSEVSTDAVRNYNDEDFDEDGNPIEEGQTEAIVEWRQGKKQKHGWPLHAGAVLFVHNNRFAIAKKMQECVEKKDLGKRLKRPLKTPKRYESSSDGSDTEPVEIYPGTGVFCDKLVWALANNSHTATSFVRTLLVNLFPLDVLLKSNLRGRSKDTTEHRPALDATKIDAIYRATLQKWPNTPQAVIGSAINGKLAELRNKSISTVYLMSDSFLGMDQQYDMYLNVMPASIASPVNIEVSDAVSDLALE
ncbi:UNVERIFIED_CONTAM: hypothetical protein FKN15_036183 [Acipenser sinensis]